jgi:hypothetical protein
VWCSVVNNGSVDHKLREDGGCRGKDVEDNVIGKVITYTQKGVIAVTGSTVSKRKS